MDPYIPPFPVKPAPIPCAKYKLGRKARKTDTRTLKVRYYIASLPAPPVAVDWTKGETAWGMLLNDSLGDCTIAGALHSIEAWGLNSGHPIMMTIGDALRYYEDFDGYDPANPDSDQGGVLLDVLNRWHQQGINGHTVTAFALVDHANLTEVKQALALFGPLYTGLQFPNSAWGQSTWTITTDTSIDGGHCVVLVGYNTVGPVAISWGALYQMTWAFFSRYFDEVYAAISPDWFEASGVDPTGLNLAQLTADLSEIR